jgi:capsular exopolysaccharide synthesis family protein
MEAAYVMEMIRTSDGLVPNVFILERAMLTSLRPVNQNFLLAGGMGLAGGLVLGLAIVFGLAFLDDRVKSSTDIEGFLGLPLIGVMPTTHRFDSFKKARLVASGEDRSVTEAFRSLYSALKINELSNTAKVFITTSTTPSEGKSFITTNLAMTYAALGEKVLILDGDLRMPAVGKTLKLEGDKGITRFLRGTVSLDDAIFHGVEPNLDVLPVGAPCKNPTQVLNSKPFADLISNLKERYDRIFIDSPPVGAVSDCLNLLPQVDGIIFIVRFNSVKRRFVKSNIRRLQEAKVPIFGAILNQIGVRVARYYTNTGDSSYSKYYSRVERDAEEIPVKP